MFGSRRKDRGTTSGRLVDPHGGEVPLPALDFLIVGAMKCGTTTLRRVLTAHPSVHMPDRELHFFGNHRRYQSIWRGGRIDVAALEEHYLQHYRTDRPVLGGKTPNYLISTLTVERIHRFHPEVKLLVMLRDPVTRAESHWNHLLRQRESGKLPANLMGSTLAEHLLADSVELDHARHPAAEVRGTNILYRGMYAEQIRRLHRFFPEERVNVLVLDDLARDPDAFFAEVFEYLELPHDPAAVAAHASPARSARRRVRLTEGERCFLREAYADSNADLERLLDRELPGWHG